MISEGRVESEMRSEGGVEVGGHMCEQREVEWELK